VLGFNEGPLGLNKKIEHGTYVPSLLDLSLLLIMLFGVILIRFIIVHFFVIIVHFFVIFVIFGLVIFV